MIQSAGRSGTETPFPGVASFESVDSRESVIGLWKNLVVALRGDVDKS